MTVISARWRSNMPFQRVGLNCYITECTGNSICLETSCGRENQHPERLSRLSSPGEQERNADGHKSEVNMLQFCSVSNSLSHTTLSNKVRGIFFLKDCVAHYYCVVVIIVLSLQQFTAYIHQLGADIGCCLDDLTKRWPIGKDGEIESEESILTAWFDEDNVCMYVCMYVTVIEKKWHRTLIFLSEQYI